MTEPYKALLGLAIRERELIEAGLWDEVVLLGQARARLVDGLPRQAPASVRPYVEEAASIVESNIAAIATARDAVGRELAHLRRGQAALASYAAAPARRQIDRRG